MIKSIILLFFAFTLTFKSLNNKIDSVKNSSINISEIKINEKDNTILVCLTNFTGYDTESLKHKNLRLRIDIGNSENIKEDLVIKEINTTLKDTFLSILPSLNDSYFRGDTRNLILTIPNVKSKINKKVVLGSIINPLDLRAYMKYDVLKSIEIALAISILFTLILISIQPLYKKYKFKKNHVKKYLIQDKKEILDPFTFVPIRSKDDIVEIKQEIMLLSSWKRLNKLSEKKITPEYQSFFNEKSGNFHSNSKWCTIKKVNMSWLTTIGIFLGWLFFILFKEAIIEETSFLSFSFLNTNSLQVSTSITTDVFFGTCIAIGFSLSKNIGNYFHKSRKFNFLQEIICTTSIVFGFTIQSLISIYIIEDREIASFLSWFFISLFFAISINLKTNFKETLLFGISIGLLTFGITEIGKLNIVTKAIGTHIPIFISLILTGTLVHFNTSLIQVFGNKIQLLHKKQK